MERSTVRLMVSLLSFGVSVATVAGLPVQAWSPLQKDVQDNMDSGESHSGTSVLDSILQSRSSGADALAPSGESADRSSTRKEKPARRPRQDEFDPEALSPAADSP